MVHVLHGDTLLQVFEVVPASHQMAWQSGAAIEVGEVLRNEVNVMEGKAVIMSELHDLHEPNVHQGCPVEGCTADLLHHKHGELNHLFLQERHHVVEEDPEVLLPGAEWKHDGDLPAWPAPQRRPVALLDPGHKGRQLLKGEVGRVDVPWHTCQVQYGIGLVMKLVENFITCILHS